jgi:hypothetical protein
MHSIGRSLSASDPVPAERLIRFWEERLQAVRNGADPAELAGFGEWFSAGKLGDEWELRQLLAALSTAGKIESEHRVLPRLSALAPAHSGTCLAILEAWVRKNPTDYWLQQQEESIRSILKAGIADGGQAADETVTTIISLCIALGHDIRDVRDE